MAGRPARYIAHEGHNLTIAQWAERCGISRGAMAARLDKLTIARALESAEHPAPAAQENPMADTYDPDEAPKQRTVDLPPAQAGPKPLEPGSRVRVYHKRRCRMFLSDCTIGPNEERDILVSDLLIPGVAEHVVKLA